VALSNDTSSSTKCLQSPDGNLGGTTISDDCDTVLRAEGEFRKSKSTDIRTVRLDDLWKRALGGGGKQRFDFIKMDIEGYEVKAWQGASEFLKSAPPYVIFTEIYPAKIVDAGNDPKEYLEIMKGAGYRGFEMLTLKEVKAVPWRADDVVFVHKDLFKELVEGLSLVTAEDSEGKVM
jgi:hypothetical protein